jgi:adenosylhomocysteine nucleosidase
MALPQESRGQLEAAGARLLYTGVGKVNAAAALARELAEMRCASSLPPVVVNLGTAGSRTIPAHTLVGCHRFAQRDMDVGGLGFPAGVTPFDEAPAVIEFPVRFAHLPQAVDSDVVDMEAFALAKACLAEKVPFACAKYITDGADSDSAAHWEAALDAASRAFADLYRSAVAPA